MAVDDVAAARLGPYDQHCLRVETPERPVHLAILALIDGAPLRAASGRVRLEEIRDALDARTATLPVLRRVVRPAGPLAGGPIWVDDTAFSLDHHLSLVTLGGLGGEAALGALVEELLARPLDRCHPLWRMWLVDGLDGGRIGVLFAIHHALADGLTAMRLIRSLLGGPVDDTDRALAWQPVAAPSWLELVGDNLRGLLRDGLALARPSIWRRALELARALWRVTALARSLPASSLNAPVGPGRRTATVRLDAALAKRVARAHGCGLNDVLLDIVAGGVRAMLAARGEPVHRLRPRAGVAVALFSAGRESDVGNDIGSVLVPLPLAEADPRLRLDAIASQRARAALSPLVAAEPMLRARLGRLPGYRRSLDQQRLINLTQTYLPGPPRPLEVLGAPVLDVIPFAPLAGNLGLSFVALSYAGALGLTVRVDADRFPDLDTLVSGMERDWHLLAAPTPDRPPSPPMPTAAPQAEREPVPA